MAEGVDLYTKFQTVNDWGALRRAGKTFAYFKGTDGMTTRDTGNWPAQARNVGIACGLYGYAQPGRAADQYDLLRRTAQQRGAVDLSPALDQEDPFVPGNAAVQFAVAWLTRAVSVGEIPVWYANDSFMSYCLPAVRAAVPTVWPWIARYGATPKNPYRTWQFSSTRKVAGVVASGVDENTGEAPIVIVGGGGAARPTPNTKLTSTEENSMELRAGDGLSKSFDIPAGAKEIRVNCPEGFITVHSAFQSGDGLPRTATGGVPDFDWKASMEEDKRVDRLRPWRWAVADGATNGSIFWTMDPAHPERTASLSFR